MSQWCWDKRVKFFFVAMMALWLATGSVAWAGTVKMRTIVVNPSTTKTQTKAIKNYLPKEVTLKDVKENGGLDVDYDSEQGLLYVHQNVELLPGETKTFELVIEDVWLIPENKLEEPQKRTETILDKLKDKPYYDQAALLANTIYARLSEISKTQNDASVSRQQHIAYYRDNLLIMENILADIEKLEKLFVVAGGTPAPELLEDAEVNLKSPTTKTTWVLIFIILIFISILGGAFYFTWQGQARVTENIFTREKDITFADFKKPQPTDADKKP